jgi:hypothetical protein
VARNPRKTKSFCRHPVERADTGWSDTTSVKIDNAMNKKRPLQCSGLSKKNRKKS